ncbi:MAG: lipoprotein-releasing ABC transporter permease subunit [Gammaproteobacteria bacterium]|nr:MAG: lipoprotein-releasing ABC transporter permease subunit [Gammaproteobacteria bacterium]|tara:strand:- start:1135 stop:2379 length:1245 start_codon:yes stop_codon:yes gene_type:complete
MRNISLFLALKYFRPRKNGFVSFHSGMAIFGITIGLSILILVTSVMNGFQKELKDRILETIPHASILGDIQQEDFTSIRDILNNNPNLIGAAPYIETQGLVSSGSFLKGVYIYGVDTDYEKSVSQISKHIVEGNFDSLDDSGFNVVIGDILAFQLGVGIGDFINVLVPDTGMGIAGIFPRTKKFKISAIFSVGAPELDQSFAFMSIKNASKLLRMGNAINGVRLKYHDLFLADYEVRSDLANLQSATKQRFQYTTWKQNYGTLFEAIQNERFLVALMLFMLIILSAYNLMSMLVMTVNEKKPQIAILMTMGATSSIIRNVFLIFGSLVGSMGILLGCFVGLLVSFNFGVIINFIESLTGIAFLQVYFIDYFPIDIRFEWVASICFITFLSCLIFTIYPSRLASKIDPVEVLKYE